jgi:hypothetical protein
MLCRALPNTHIQPLINSACISAFLQVVGVLKTMVPSLPLPELPGYAAPFPILNSRPNNQLTMLLVCCRCLA